MTTSLKISSTPPTALPLDTVVWVEGNLLGVPQASCLMSFSGIEEIPGAPYGQSSAKPQTFADTLGNAVIVAPELTAEAFICAAWMQLTYAEQNPLGKPNIYESFFLELFNDEVFWGGEKTGEAATTAFNLGTNALLSDIRLGDFSFPLFKEFVAAGQSAFPLSLSPEAPASVSPPPEMPVEPATEAQPVAECPDGVCSVKPAKKTSTKK